MKVIAKKTMVTRTLITTIAAGMSTAFVMVTITGVMLVKVFMIKIVVEKFKIVENTGFEMCLRDHTNEDCPARWQHS